MFGYIICDKKGIDKDELQRYRSFYCGICKALSNYGQNERLYLNYDMTFLAFFLCALYEPSFEIEKYRCLIHPVKSQKIEVNKYIEYAADMTILLAYHKCMDDYIDDKSIRAYKRAEKLKKSYDIVKNRYPRQCKSVENSLNILHQIEADSGSSPDAAIVAAGNMLSELFVYEEDFWAEDMRSFGYSLGRFVYLMDATCDYNKDIKSGSYNPLIKMNLKPNEMEEILKIEIGKVADIFERLPIISDAHLIRNIIYSGVWQKFDSKGLSKPVDNLLVEEGITNK